MADTPSDCTARPSVLLEPDGGPDLGARHPLPDDDHLAEVLLHLSNGDLRRISAVTVRAPRDRTEQLTNRLAATVPNATLRIEESSTEHIVFVAMGSGDSGSGSGPIG